MPTNNNNKQSTTTRVSTTDDDEYDDEDNEVSSVSPTLTTTTTQSTNPDSVPDTNESDYTDNNNSPYVDKRIPKAAVVAGKPFSIEIEEDVFQDEEDGTNLRLELLNKDKSEINASSWIQFDASKRSIYGLPIEKLVSKYEFVVRATDKAGAIAEEIFEITVQQFKGSRNVNNEVSIMLSLEKDFKSNVDWQILLIQEIVDVVGAKSTKDIIVREVIENSRIANQFTFTFTNDSLANGNECPTKKELDEMLKNLRWDKLNIRLEKQIRIRNIGGLIVGENCEEKKTTPPPHNPQQGAKQNFPPTVKNPIDNINASVGQLLVYRIPDDTFYDPEDFNILELTLIDDKRNAISPDHWLQFDSRNREFYGVPSIVDIANQTFVLVAADSQGLTVRKAFVFEIENDMREKDLSVNFDFHIDMPAATFRKAGNQRKFVEILSQIFGDKNTSNILLSKVVDRIGGKTSVQIRNTTLEYEFCPNKTIEKLRSVLLHSDGSVRSDVKQKFEPDFQVFKILTTPMSELFQVMNLVHQMTRFLFLL